MKELTILRLFSPLTANLYAPDEYGGLSDWPEELTPAALCGYEGETTADAGVRPADGRNVNAKSCNQYSHGFR